MGRESRAGGRAAAGGAAGRRSGESFWQVSRPLALLLLGAALFRAVYLFLYARHSFFFDGLILDSTIYDAWARRIAAGAWIGKEAFYLPPLYSYAVGLVYRLIDPGLGMIFVLQLSLGLVNLLLINRIGEALVGRRAGLIAACGAALYGPLAFFETKILATTLGLTLNLVALFLMIRAERGPAGPGGRRRFLVTGGVIGLSATCTPATALLAPVYAALSMRRRPRAAAWLLAGALAGVSPVLLHNLYVARDPLLLSGQGGITFYQGNHRGSPGLYAMLPGFSGSPERQPDEERSIAERETGRRDLRRSEVSGHFFRKGLRDIVDDPLAWLWLEIRKLGWLVGSYEASTEYSLLVEREQVPWLHVAFLPYALIVACGCAGMLLARGASPGRRGGVPLAAYTLYAAAVPLLFYVSSRYRLPLVPALLIYGAFFIDTVVDALRGAGLASRQRSLLAGAGLLALVSFFPLGRPNVSAEANVHYNVATLLAERGHHEQAIEVYDRAVAEWPGNAYAWVNRGNSLDRLGRPEEALTSYRRAEQANAGFWTAYKAQGVILHRLQRLQDEAETYRRGLDAGGAEAHYLLGLTLDAIGRQGEIRDLAYIEQAVGHYREAIRIEPRDARFHNALAMALYRTGDAGGAIEAYLAANRADPRYGKSRYNLASLYADRGRLDEAAALLREAVAGDPEYARAHTRLGEVLALQGDSAGARRAFERALALQPGDAAARTGLARLGG